MTTIILLSLSGVLVCNVLVVIYANHRGNQREKARHASPNVIPMERYRFHAARGQLIDWSV